LAGPLVEFVVIVAVILEPIGDVACLLEGVDVDLADQYGFNIATPDAL
jgi:hypothetical protein